MTMKAEAEAWMHVAVAERMEKPAADVVELEAKPEPEMAVMEWGKCARQQRG